MSIVKETMKEIIESHSRTIQSAAARVVAENYAMEILDEDQDLRLRIPRLGAPRYPSKFHPARSQPRLALFSFVTFTHYIRLRYGLAHFWN
jgi:hypothetical protein